MASQTKIPATWTSNSGVGTVPWTDPTNAAADDGANAVANVSSSTSRYLHGVGCSFDAFLSDATINSITVRVERFANGGTGTIKDSTLRMVIAGAVDSAEWADTATAWPGSATVATYVINSGLPTAAQVLAADFGIALSAVHTGAGGSPATVDYISIEVSYTSGPAYVDLTGTCAETSTSVLREPNIVAGGKTIILTLRNETWVAAGATFDAQRQNIINGLDSAQAEATGWDAEVKAKLAVTDVVRTSSLQVTITLSAQAAYNITAQETITATVPGTALTLGFALVASPTFRVVPTFNVVGHLGGLRVGGQNRPRMMATARRAIVPMGLGKRARR